MIGFDRPLVLLLAIPVLGFVVAIWRTGFSNLEGTQSRAALALRLGMVSLIVLGLAGAGITVPQTRQAVVVSADLSASDAARLDDMETAIRAAGRLRPASDRLGVVSFGGDARVEQPVAAGSRFAGFQTAPDPNYTNIAAGLLLSNAIIPNGYQRRVVLMSDGWQNAGDAVATAALLHSLGTRVDVWPVRHATGPEVSVQSVMMPSNLRTKESFGVSVRIQSNVSSTAKLDLYRDKTLVLSREEHVRIGQTFLSFSQPPLATGFHRYEAEITPEVDTEPENNSASAFTIVAGPPKVLVISPTRGDAHNVVTSLRATGIHAVYETPEHASPDLGVLQTYAGIVLVNTPAFDLFPGFANALVPYVRDLGRGLVVIGGNESFGAGNYGHTGLERALPVTMDIPKRKYLPTLAVVLIIEDLESNSSVNISKAAGKGVVNLLNPRDQIAVSPADQNGYFAVTLQHVTDRARIDHRIDVMSPSDPMTYVPDLRASYDALRKAHAAIKHIVLVGDGDAYDGRYESVLKKIRAGGITVSTVGTNGGGFGYAANDLETMKNIAMWGGGRFYDGTTSRHIPKIFLRETQTVARVGIVQGKFFPQQLSSDAMLKDLHGLAPLTGYVATTPKPTGDIILASKKLDPVLAAWQFGLGRSVAWTSDSAGEWTRAWLRAPGVNRFWADLVSWTLPAQTHGHLYVSASASRGLGRISVQIPQSLGGNPTVTARVVGPQSSGSPIRLHPAAPGLFEGSFAAATQGAYYITADARGSGHGDAGEAGLDVSYSSEYLTSGTNLTFDRQLAKAGGGSLISNPDAFWHGNLAPASSRTSLASWLWLLALLLFPIDIAVRRLRLTARDVEIARQKLSRTDSGIAGPSHVPLASLRQQRESTASLSLPRRSSRSAKTARAAAKAPSPEHPSAGGSATTSKLLEAKRRRR